MNYGLRFVAFVGIAGPLVEAGAREGAWIASYDPDAHDGRGAATWTDDPAAALAFDSPREALACWTQVSTVRPVRWNDGKPNRPLTALTLEVAPLQ